MFSSWNCTIIVLVIHLVGCYSDQIYEIGEDSIYDLENIFAFWPSQNIRQKRALTEGQNQGIVPGTDDKSPSDTKKIASINDAEKEVKTALTNYSEKDKSKEVTNAMSNDANKEKNKTPKVTVTANNTVTNETDTTKNITKIKTPVDNGTPSQVDLSNPGVVKRGLIVFGGFALLGVAYFIFYRRKKVKNENSSMHNTSDGPQFRYGVLQSEDRRDNLELSRVPLTMESDEDDEDDLEIFDLEQKKKSLSYVNLQSNTEDMEQNSLTDNSRNNNDRDTLLLDIDDRIPDNMLINLTNSNHKSIL